MGEPGSVTADLPLEEVRRLIEFLSDATLHELAEGPLPDLEPGDPGYVDAGDCRVCQALGPLTSSGPAKALLTWHDLVTESFDIVRGFTRAEVDRPIVREVQEMIGALSYARCCTIYALADAELARRRGLLPAMHNADHDEPFAAFVAAMADELRANQHKGDRAAWTQVDPRVLVSEVLYHAAKLSYALRQHRQGDGPAQSVVEFAADTANMALMVADSAGVLCSANGSHA